jgi:hypothetical protein
MGVLKSALLPMTLGIVLAFSAVDASAQMFNQPFSFKSRGGQVGSGSSVGMSTAYRQLILERELLGRAAKNPLVRDYSGALLQVQRGNSGQAFLSSQASSFIPGTSRRGFATGGSGLGYAYGLGTSDGSDSSYGLVDYMQATPVRDVMAAWISAIDGRGGMQGAYHPSGATSMDAWIGQLHLL